ncbi:MAG: transporter associated domain-containing protein, partial [Gemmatimonadota bacterium]
HARDLVPLLANPELIVLRDLLRTPTFVPWSTPVQVLLRDMQRKHQHMMVVVDEYGGIMGAVTLEDVLEEIVGEIRDEHDIEAAPEIRRDGERVWVDGGVGLDELSEALGRPFTHPDVSTVGGLIFSELGRVPRAGEELTMDGFRVVVERVERRRVRRVYFEPR